ncbi:MAG: nucleoside hydrolase [Thermoguttaceae bacterium]
MQRSFVLLKLALSFAVLGVAALSSLNASAKEPVKIIYDTDMGNDIDDVFALTMLNNLEKRGEVELLAITLTKDNKYAAPYCQMINLFYQNPNVPIGAVKESGVTADDGKFLRQSLELKDEEGNPAFPFFNYDADETEYYEATALLRKTLASQEDGSVVITQVGFSTNLARLLDSPADEYSPLTGRELAAKKVKYLVPMAGNFVEKHQEFNVICDVPSARKLFAEWPTDIYCSGFEVGREITISGVTMLNDYDYVKYHPVKEAYKFYRGLDPDAQQCTWDLTTILFAARPDRGYFDFSEPGTIVIDEEGYSTFEPQADGKARLFKVNREQIIRVSEAFEWLCSERLLN